MLAITPSGSIIQLLIGTAHPDTNVVIWSWCGQVSNISEQDLIDHYLLPMTQLEINYPGITFVYMTGH